MWQDEARASLETTIIEPPGDQLDPAVRVRQYLEHAAAMQEVRLSESDALTAGATWAVPKSWDGERAGPVRAQTTLASTQHPEAGPVEDALGPTVNPGSQTGLGPKPQVARPGKGRGGRVNGLHSAQRGPAVIRFQDSAPTSSRLHQKPRRTAAAAQAKAVQRRAPAIPDTGPSTRTASNVAARNYRDSRSLSVQGVPGKRFVPRRIEASTGAVLVATLAKSESTLVSEPPGSWTTAGDIDGNSLAELQALQRELGIPVSDTLPSYGESMVSSDISGLSAFLDTHRRGVQVAADRAIQAVASVKRGPVHDRDTSRGPDLEQDDQVPEPRPLLLTAAVSRADRVAPTPSRPVRQSGPEATADVDAANPQAEPQLPRASSPKYGSPPAKVTRRSGGWSHPSSPARDMMGQSAAEATRLRQQLLSELSDAASAGRTSSRATVGGSAPNSPVVGSSSWEAEHLKRRPVSAAGYSRPSLPGERPPIEESYRSPDRVSSIPDSDPSTGDLGSAALTGLSVLVEKARIEALRASATAKISQPLLPQEAIDQLHSVPSSASSDHTSLSRAVPSEAAVLRDDAQISPASSTISSLSDLIPDVRWHISQRIPADVEISPTSSDEDELPDESEDSWVYKDSRGRTNFQSLMPAGVNDQAQSSIQAKRTDHAAEVGLEPDTSLDSSGLTSLSSLAERSLPRFNFAAPASVPWEAQSHTGHRVSQTPEERETHGLSSPASSGFTGLSALAPDQPPTDSTADIPGDHIAPVPGALAGESGLDVLKQEDMSGDPNESEGSPHEEVAWRGEATGPEEERGMTLTPETLTKLAAYISEQAYRSGLYPGAVAGAASTRGDVPQQGDETAHSCSAPSSLAQVFLGGPEELPRNSATEWLAGQGGEVGKITTGGMTYPGQLHIAHEGRGSEETEESAMGPAEQMATLVAAEHARQLQGLWGQERKTKDSFQTGCSSPLDEAYEEPGPLGLDPLPSNQPTEPDASEMLHEMENLSGGMELRRLGPTAEADNRFSRQLLDVDSSSGISVYSHLLERPTPAPSAAPSISISVASSSLRRAAAASVMGDMRAVETAAAAKQRTTAALAPSSYAGSDHGSERPSHSRANSEPQVGLNATAAEGSRPRSADGEVYSPSGQPGAIGAQILLLAFQPRSLSIPSLPAARWSELGVSHRYTPRVQVQQP